MPGKGMEDDPSTQETCKNWLWAASALTLEAKENCKHPNGHAHLLGLMSWGRGKQFPVWSQTPTPGAERAMCPGELCLRHTSWVGLGAGSFPHLIMMGGGCQGDTSAGWQDPPRP